jgi:hypothetical protein
VRFVTPAYEWHYQCDPFYCSSIQFAATDAHATICPSPTYRPRFPLCNVTLVTLLVLLGLLSPLDHLQLLSVLLVSAVHRYRVRANGDQLPNALSCYPLS